MPRAAVMLVTINVSTNSVRSALSSQTAICGPRSSRSMVSAQARAGGPVAVGLEVVAQDHAGLCAGRGGPTPASTPPAPAASRRDVKPTDRHHTAILVVPGGRARPPGCRRVTGSCMFGHANRHRRRRHEDRRAGSSATTGASSPASGNEHRPSTRPCCGPSPPSSAGSSGRAAGRTATVGIGTPGVLQPGSGAHSQREPRCPSTTPAGSRPRRGARPPGAARQRRQVLRAVGGGGRRGGAARRSGSRAAGRRVRRDAGTGVGGGIVVDGRVLTGENGAATEWSHTTLPFLREGSMPLRLRVRPRRLHRVVHVGPRR